jgi:hypothetical protein
MNGTTLVKYNGSATNVTIPSNVTVIGEKVFQSKKLTSVTIPNSVTSIGNFAFYGNNLTSVTIPNSVTSIGSNAFSSNKFTSVTIPNSVTSIGSSAFGQNELISVSIPKSVTSIGSYAFHCERLTSIEAAPDNAYFSSEGGILYNKDKTKLIMYPRGKSSGGTYNIPNNVTSIETAAFNDCKLSGIVIPNSVTSIGSYAFGGNNLTSVNIPVSVTSIGGSAFAYNDQLNSVTIGANVTIGSGVFSRHNDKRDIINSGFEEFYEKNGKKAGTYTYTNNGNWTFVAAPSAGPDKAAYDRGRAAYTQKNYDMAITEFTEAIRLNPNYELAYYFRAETYVYKEDYDKALADFTQAIRLSPNDTDNYNERGYVYIIRNEYDRAIADFNQTLKIDPNNTDAKEGLELVQQRKQNASPAAAPVQPAAPPATANVNPNFIPPSAWKPVERGQRHWDSPGVTKRFFNTREAIAGQERDVLTMEVTFTRQTNSGGTSKWGGFVVKDESIVSKLRMASGVRFKVLGDGKRWVLIVDTNVAEPGDTYRAEIKTTNNRVVDINMPFSSLKQGSWVSSRRPFVKNNIISILIQRHTDTASETGASTLKVFDFEIY